MSWCHAAIPDAAAFAARQSLPEVAAQRHSCRHG